MVQESTTGRMGNGTSGDRASLDVDMVDGASQSSIKPEPTALRKKQIGVIKSLKNTVRAMGQFADDLHSSYAPFQEDINTTLASATRACDSVSRTCDNCETISRNISGIFDEQFLQSIKAAVYCMIFLIIFILCERYMPNDWPIQIFFSTVVSWLCLICTFVQFGMLVWNSCTSVKSVFSAATKPAGTIGGGDVVN